MRHRLVMLIMPLLASVFTSTASAQEKTPMKSIYEVPIQAMAEAGETSTSLAAYKGKVVLVVNVASKCGFTPQYQGLEALYERYRDKGFVVVGFPCNDFGAQEPGSEGEILQFCRKNYGVSFPIMAKIHTLGEEKSPLYQYLTGASSPFPGDVKWNFEKFLVGKDGKVAGRFRSAVTPESETMTKAVEAELAR